MTVDFPGTQGIKRRPAVVVSSSIYHLHRPDVIVGIVTSQVERAKAPTDYVLEDWERPTSIARLRSARFWLHCRLPRSTRSVSAQAETGKPFRNA